MELKFLLIAISHVIPGVIIGFIFGYLDRPPESDYDAFEDYYGRKE